MLKLRFENWHLRNVNDNRTLHQTFHSCRGWRAVQPSWWILQSSDIWSRVQCSFVTNVQEKLATPTARILRPPWKRKQQGSPNVNNKWPINTGPYSRRPYPSFLRYQHSTIERSQTLRSAVMLMQIALWHAWNAKIMFRILGVCLREATATSIRRVVLGFDPQTSSNAPWDRRTNNGEKQPAVQYRANSDPHSHTCSCKTNSCILQWLFEPLLPSSKK